MKSIGVFDYEKDIFKMKFNHDGPQGQLVYSLRFPVAYKNCQLISQRCDFTNYFDWMGQIREYSLRPVMTPINNLVKSGRWGLATNTVNLKIFDVVKSSDVLEGRVWLDRISGRNNIYHLAFDWLRYVKSRVYERVALSWLVFTCVEIISPGKAVIAMPPTFLKKFLDEMQPRDVKRTPLKPYPTLLGGVDLGKRIKDCNSFPKFLFKNSYQTSLENSNLVGNIYFSNYSKWANSTKDIYLNNINSDIFKKSDFDGEFVTVECRVSHAGEAMPFDTIIVKMYLLEMYEKGVVLRCEIERKGSHDSRVKLASVTQRIAFVKYRPVAKIVDIPPLICRAFQTFGGIKNYAKKY